MKAADVWLIIGSLLLIVGWVFSWRWYFQVIGAVITIASGYWYLVEYNREWDE